MYDNAKAFRASIAALDTKAPPLTRRHAGGLLLGALAASIMPGTTAIADLPPPVVKIVDFDWIDATRGRPVPSRLYWPETAARQARVPLIVFSHGLGGLRSGYSYLGRHWSSRGVASLHVQHAGSDRSVWQGNPLAMLDRLDVAAQEAEALDRARDLSFALDRILDEAGSSISSRIDRRRITAAGHSYGANTTLIIAGARVQRESRLLEARDVRFKAGIVISAPPFYGEKDLRTVLRSIDIPTLHVTATDDVILIPGRYSPLQDRLDIFNALNASRKMIVVFKGGSHSIFTDRTMTGGLALNPLVKDATASASLAFLDLAFRADSSGISTWIAKWRAILAVDPKAFTSPA